MKEIIQSAIWKLNSSDLVKVIKTAIFTAFIGAVYVGFKEHGVHLLAYDWQKILDVSITAGVGRLFERLMSDEQGKLLGKI